VTVKSLAERNAASKPHFHGIIKDVTALGFGEEVAWERDEEGLKIRTQNVKSEYPVVFKIRID